MTEEKIKRMLDACFLAKRIRDFLPELPDGVKPAYIQYMDTIHKLQGNGVQRVKISDISDSLAIPRPGVTRTVKEMEERCYLKKISSDEDARITYIEITVKGEELSEKYDKNYYSRLCRYLDGISEEEADCMINTIEKFYKVMSERCTPVAFTVQSAHEAGGSVEINLVSFGECGIFFPIRAITQSFRQ